MIQYTMKPDVGKYVMTGYGPKLIHTVITKAIKKNWWVIAFYVVINASGVVAAYFLTAPWLSVAASLGVAIVSTVVGYFMMSQVVTITKEVH
jgi:hypothetical protein